MSEKTTILILGNGFDLAHELPTSYRNFLEFCRYLGDMMGFNGPDASFEQELQGWPITENMRKEFSEAFSTRITKDNHTTVSNNVLQKIFDLTAHNVWYLFMYKLLREQSARGMDWIDFEAEIRNVISFADRMENDLTAPCKEFLGKFNDMKYMDGVSGSDIAKLGHFREKFGYSYHYAQKAFWPETVSGFRKYLYKQLENFIEAMGLYFSHFVNKQSCDKLETISALQPEYVLNFNYTNTYERLYTSLDCRPEIIYIHGNCSPVSENNMVLGINEYWQTQEEIKSHVNYAIFKKYFQRIRKHTLDKYCVFLRNIDKTQFHVHVFGHSLDVTDEDILIKFFEPDNADVTIHCHCKKAEEELIARMIMLIGSDSMTEKIMNGTLRFEVDE